MWCEYCNLNYVSIQKVQTQIIQQHKKNSRRWSALKALTRVFLKEPRAIQITASPAAGEPNLLDNKHVTRKRAKERSSEFRCLLEDQDNLHKFTFLQTFSQICKVSIS